MLRAFLVRACKASTYRSEEGAFDTPYGVYLSVSRYTLIAEGCSGTLQGETVDDGTCIEVLRIFSRHSPEILPFWYLTGRRVMKEEGSKGEKVLYIPQPGNMQCLPYQRKAQLPEMLPLARIFGEQKRTGRGHM